MKHLIIFFIFLYQLFVSPLLKLILGVPSMCHFSPTCAEYTKNMIQQYGVIIGTRRGLERIATCR